MALTDLHCHILPRLDDGAKDMQTALGLLKMQVNQGVRSIVFTPHFDFERVTVDEFIAARARSAQALAKALQKTNLKFRASMGAEIFFSPHLMRADIKPLCFQNTPYVLIELPVPHCPANLREVFYHVQLQGYSPILAHVERYPYLLQDPVKIYELVQSGVLIQVNAGSMVRDARMAKRIFQLMQWNLVQLVASDAHSLNRRPPKLEEAFQVIHHRLGADVVRALKKNAENVFKGKSLLLEDPQKPVKLLGGRFA